jgi:hypothetical protein
MQARKAFGGLDRLTLDGLLLVEIILHRRDGRVQALETLDNRRQILQNQLSRRTGVVPAKLLKVMPNAAANVDEQDRIRTRVGTADQALLYGEEPRCHPGKPALAVAAHVIVEVREVTLILQEGEEVLICAVRVVHGRVLCVCRVLPPALAAELVQLELRGARASWSILRFSGPEPACSWGGS